MTEFGDYTEDDAYDTAPPDPLQVAIKLAAFMDEDWRNLSPAARDRRTQAIARLLAWLRRSGGLR